jgi:hypothetical protein
MLAAVSYLSNAACIFGIPGLLVAPNTFGLSTCDTRHRSRSKIRGLFDRFRASSKPQRPDRDRFLDDGLIQIAVGPVRLTVRGIRVFRIPPDGLTIELFP